MILTIEEVLKKIGPYGKTQKLLDLLFSVMNIPIGMQVLITTFTAITPSWKCVSNSTHCPYNDTRLGNDRSRCNLQRTSWEYTKTKEFSMVTQFDIHCKKEWLLILLYSIFFFGWGLGAIVLGSIGDRFGRKLLLFPSYAIILVCGFITSFLPNIYLIVVCRFITGFFLHGSTTQAYILISEIVGSKHRSFACLILFLSTSIGWVILALQAYLIPNWKTLSIVTSAPYIFALFFYKFIPESIQWLMLRGRTTQVMDTLSTIASRNGKVLPKGVIIASTNEDTTVQKSSIIDIFRTAKLAKQSLVIGYLWIAIGMGYYGLYIAANDLGGSLHRDFIILSLGDIPALFLSIYLCNKFGRKPCTIVPLLIGGLICVAIGCTPFDYKTLRIVMGNLGKLFICTAFDGIYTWSVEIFPTDVRSSGMGFTTITARIGSTAAPWVVKGLEPIATWCPFLALGVPAIVGFFLGTVLPETRENKCQDTNDATEVGLDNVACNNDVAESYS